MQNFQSDIIDRQIYFTQHILMQTKRLDAVMLSMRHVQKYLDVSSMLNR